MSRSAMIVVVVLVPLLAGACGRSDRNRAESTGLASPTGPASGTVMRSARGFEGPWGPNDVAFPPRNLSFDFRQNALEPKYRDGLRRSSSSTFVDVEGDVVWTQEYLRYRINGCDHQTATAKVFAQIDGGGIQPVCRDVSALGVVEFPPRNEPYDFRLQLEAKYRDQLRRAATSTFVDIEGSSVWTQEYLRYMVNCCDHSESTSKVLDQIDGRGVQPVCAPPLCTWQYQGADLAPAERGWTVSAAATTREIVVTTSAAYCGWSVEPQLPRSFLTVTPASGSGSGRIRVSVAANTTGGPRGDSLVFTPPPTGCFPFCGIERTFTVFQSP